MTRVQDLFKNKQLNQEIIEDFRKNKYITLHTTSKCNLGCPYCVNHKKGNMMGPQSTIERVGVERYIIQLDKLLKGVKNLTVDFIGEGEVLTDPAFPRLFKWCMEHKYDVIVQTNLFGVCINQFEKATMGFSKEELQRVTVGTSYHVGAFADLFPNPRKVRDKWLEGYKRLATLGVKLGRIEVPMTLYCLMDKKLHSEFQMMKDLGGHPAPVALVGAYGGKHYPESYTSDQLSSLQYDLDLWREEDEKIAIRVKKWNAEQLPHVEHQTYLQRNPCYKRMHSIEIMRDGRIRYCQSYPYWWYGGHLINGTFPDPVFEDKPVNCPIPACGCDTIGIRHCLRPQGIDIAEYYHAYYLDKNKPGIAEKFKKGL